MEFLYSIVLDPVNLLVISLILIGWFVNLVGVDQKEPIVNFSYKEMPSMKPICIPTAGKGFWGSIVIWLFRVRTWEIDKDWHFSIGDNEYFIPKGFVFDGASVPKFLGMFLSPTGILLLGGLVHDFIYAKEHLILKNQKKSGKYTQKEADELFRDICIEQNGIHVLNYAAYYALRLGGWYAWNTHRKS